MQPSFNIKIQRRLKLRSYLHNKKLFFLNITGSRLFVVLLILLFASIILYWLFFRPRIIKNKCYKDITQQLRENVEGNRGYKEGKQWTDNPIKMEGDDWGWWYPIHNKESIIYQYDECLYKKGVIDDPPFIEKLRDL